MGKRDRRRRRLRKLRKKPVDIEIERLRAAELTKSCVSCGHPKGEHYLQGGWPACSKCTDCNGFTDG